MITLQLLRTLNAAHVARAEFAKEFGDSEPLGFELPTLKELSRIIRTGEPGVYGALIRQFCGDKPNVTLTDAMEGAIVNYVKELVIQGCARRGRVPAG